MKGDLHLKKNSDGSYVEANGLDIIAYKDYGWDPVDLGLSDQ